MIPYKIKHFLYRYSLIPPKKWRVPAIILVASFLGIGLYTLKLSNAVSYLSDDPKACINCHLMTPQYITWNHSSHREVAHCNDCHVPQDNIFNKFYFKAKDGLYHSSIFTIRAEPQVIKALGPSIEVIKEIKPKTVTDLMFGPAYPVVECWLLPISPGLIKTSEAKNASHL